MLFEIWKDSNEETCLIDGDNKESTFTINSDDAVSGRPIDFSNNQCVEGNIILYSLVTGASSILLHYF